MLGKVSWWDNEAKMGAVQDVEGKEWKIFDDMIDDDSIKAKMKNGLVINFEANPSLDNSAMRIDVATQDDQKKYDDNYKALLRAVESKLPNTGLGDWCPSLIESKTLSEAEPKPIDLKALSDKAPHDLQDFVDLIIDFDASTTVDEVKETMEDGDKLSEMADGYIDTSYSVLWKWYAEDVNRGDYIDAAVEEGLVDMSTLKKGISHLLMVGQYAYNTEKLAEAVTWLEEQFKDLPEVEQESVQKLKTEEVGDDPIDQYLETAIWSSTGDKGEELDSQYGINDFSEEALSQAEDDWARFKTEADKYLDGLDLSDVAHDFWLTRNGHGAGFWDGDYEKEIGKKLTQISKKYGPLHVVVGDDGKLEFE